MTVPSNLVPTSITQLPVAPNPTSSATMVCVIEGITYQVQFIDLQSTVSVPASRAINTGGGLQGGGDLSQDRTLSIATEGVTSDKLAVSGVTAGTYGSGAVIPVVTVSPKGLITEVTETPLVISGYVPDTRQVIAGAGLTGGGNLQANRTFQIDFSAANPTALGTASAGSANAPSRGDHAHPALDFANLTEYSGRLPLTRGGTGMQVNNLTAGALWYTDGNNGFLQTTQGLPGQVLISGGSAAPTWGTAGGGGGGVTQLIAGTNVTLSPSSGVGVVTINASGSGSSLPSQTGNAGKYLKTDGTNASWNALPTYLPITTHAGTTTDVSVANGFLPVLGHGGSTTNVTVS